MTLVSETVKIVKELLLLEIEEFETNGAESPASLTKTDIERCFDRLTNIIENKSTIN